MGSIKKEIGFDYYQVYYLLGLVEAETSEREPKTDEIGIE